MPLPKAVWDKLEEVNEVSEGFALFGLFINTSTGEIGTYSSDGFQPGAVLGFLQNATQQMIDAAMNGELHGTEAQAGATPERPFLITGGNNVN